MLKAKDKPCRTRIRTTENAKMAPLNPPLRGRKSLPRSALPLPEGRKKPPKGRDVENYDELLRGGRNQGRISEEPGKNLRGTREESPRNQGRTWKRGC